MIIEKRLSANSGKIYYRFKWGNGPFEKCSSGVYTYVRPKDQNQRNFNKEALVILEIKRSQLVIDQQAIGTGFIPAHRYKNNFLDFYDDFVKKNARDGKRHLAASLNHFKTFVKKNNISPIEITEDLCQRFRNHLLDKFNGETPMNYFSEFKRMVRAATKQGYFKINPAEDIKAKKGKNSRLKSHLEVEDYIKLLKTPCLNEEVREAFIFCCYTGLRWADVSQLNWDDLGKDTVKTRLMQVKTGLPVVITIHPVAKGIIDKRRDRTAAGNPLANVFILPTADGANKVLRGWIKDAKIEKKITWSSARLSFSILLQDERVDAATVALLLGHSTTKYVNSTYKRHRLSDHAAIIAKLPMPVKVAES